MRMMMGIGQHNPIFNSVLIVVDWFDLEIDIEPITILPFWMSKPFFIRFQRAKN